jgi:hypothetical protein
MPKAAGDCNNRTTAVANGLFGALQAGLVPRAARKEPDRTARTTGGLKNTGSPLEPNRLYARAALRQNASAIIARSSESEKTTST